MATVSITYFTPSFVKESSAVIEVEGSVTEVITSSGTSQSTTASTTDRNNLIRIAVSGGNVYVDFGTSPTASSGDDMLLIDGTESVFHAPVSYKVAVID